MTLFSAHYKPHDLTPSADLTGIIEVPNTKGFQNWIVIDREISLDAGEHVLKVVIDGNFVNLDKTIFTAAE